MDRDSNRTKFPDSTKAAGLQAALGNADADPTDHLGPSACGGTNQNICYIFFILLSFWHLI